MPDYIEYVFVDEAGVKHYEMVELANARHDIMAFTQLHKAVSAYALTVEV